MSWFSKKNITELAKTGPDLKIQVIPDDFYGGKDPVVHYQKLEKKITKNVPDSFYSKNKKKIFIFSGIFLVVFIAGATYYYIQVGKSSGLNIEVPTTPVETNIPEDNFISPPASIVTTSEQIIEEPTTTIVENLTSTISTTTVFAIPTMLFPNINLLDSVDSDSDSLTDKEEETFKTDPKKWDTDGDGYYDGLEVFNLYNPTGFAPVKIIDSGLVKEYVNPVWQYRVYYPAIWEVGTVDPQSRQVLFSSISGDFISIETIKRQLGESFATWFNRETKGQQFNDLLPLKNRFQEVGWKRKDSLIAYFEASDKIYVIIYHPAGDSPIDYRHVIQMIVNSIRLGKTVVELPDQPVLAPAPDFTVLVVPTTTISST